MRQRKYYFGKINLVGEYVTDRQQQLWAALDSPSEVSSSEKYLWTFVDTERLQAEGDEYYIGQLVKFTDEADKTVDRESHRTQKVVIDDRIVAEAGFIIHAESGLIAYQRDGSQIKPDMFRKYFGQVVVRHFQGFFFECEVRVVGDFEEFEKRLRRFSKLEALNVEVHTTNPGRKAYAGIEEELRRVNAHTKKLGYEAPSGQGLDIENHDDILAYIEMVSDGYGEAKAAGEREGHFEEVSSEEQQDTMFAPTDADFAGVFTVLKDKFEEILDRLGYE